MDYIFGGDLSVPVRFAIAFGVVLSLIAITFVALRRLAGRKLPLSNGGRARQPRLGVLDAFAIDARRRLVLIRRDNVEHLIMIGGPNDVLIESEIVRAPAQAALPAQTARRAPGEATRAAVAPPARGNALPAPDQPAAPLTASRPETETAGRPAAFRNVFARPPGEPQPAPQSARPAAPPPPAQLRPQQRPQPQVATEDGDDAPPPAPAAKPKADVDPLYADIERKLGEALSRPSSQQPQTPPAPQRSAPPPPAQRSAPPPFARPSAPPIQSAPPTQPAAPPAAAQRPAPPPPPQRSAPPPPPAAREPKNHLDALEEEMASLLGRDRSS